MDLSMHLSRVVVLVAVVVVVVGRGARHTPRAYPVDLIIDKTKASRIYPQKTE